MKSRRRAPLSSALVTVLVAWSPPAVAETVVRTHDGLRCTVVGSAASDVLRGTSGRDVICGRGGADRISGGGSDDVVDAGAGSDRVTGGSGRDVVSGGRGDDTLLGADGDDRLGGGLGDDQLTGGSGGDAVDGGAGFNLCDRPAATSTGDTQVRCAVDREQPQVTSVSVAPATVDVSASAQRVRVRVRVTDDTGVAAVQAWNAATLVSGTPRDGVWETTLRVPRYVEPGPRDLDVFVRDRVGRDVGVTRRGAYDVVNSRVDREMPQLRSLRLDRASVDVRASAQTITATARVTDDLAGSDYPVLCPARAFPTGEPRFRQAGACERMEKVSGTATDSVWRATYTVARGAPSGTWNFAVWLSDAAGNRNGDDFWYGPDQFAANGPVPDPWIHAVPDGGGAFQVVGTTPDTHAPVLGSLRLTPSVVDTSRGAVRITADVRASDVEGLSGVFVFVSGWPGYPDAPEWTSPLTLAWVEDFVLQSGTRKDGVWRATFVVPAGTPDGEYSISVGLEDSSHFESWASPDPSSPDERQVLTPQLAPTGVRFVVANS